MHACSLGLYRHAERIFFFVVCERSPGSGVLGKYDRPFLCIRDHVQSIASLVEWLAFDLDGIAEGDRRVEICSRAPHLAVGNQGGRSPNLAIIDQWPVIVDRDVGDADAL